MSPDPLDTVGETGRRFAAVHLPLCTSTPSAVNPVTTADRVYAALAPLAFRLLHAGARAAGADRGGLRQRAGWLPDCAAPCLWLHGASAGEMAAAANLVALLRARGFAFSAAYTTTNRAGLDLIARRLAPCDVSGLAPWDAPRWVARALEHWQPAALVLVETELWPALIRAAAGRGVPVLCASARIYPRDVARYRLIRRFMRPTLGRLSAVLAQSEGERARFVALGAAAARCTVAGNLKHATTAPPAREAEAFRRAIGLGERDRVWVCGSVHEDEVELLCAASERVPAGLARVIVAPRHAAVVTALEAAARRRSWALARRSAPSRDGWHVLVLDSMGELRAAYAGAAVAVVGGSFAAHGGHDLAEPVRCGAPVLFGPHIAHVEAEATALRGAVPSAEVRTPVELADRLSAWLGDDQLRRSVLSRQRAALPDPVAVAEHYASALEPWLQRCRSAATAQPSF